MPEIVKSGSKLEKLADGYAFTEGPAADPHGNVYFTDQPNDRIVKWSTDGKVEDWMKPCGRCNGMRFDHQGHIIACADEKNRLIAISPDKSVRVLLEDHGGKLLNGPNDVWVRPDGGIYITDPLYERSYWSRTKDIQQGGEHVLFLSPQGNACNNVATDLNKPNGIVGTPDGKLLYVGDIGANVSFRYRIQPDGSLTEKRLFCNLGSDGMTIDHEGNIYLTGHGVTVFNPKGEQILHVDVPERWTGNITFAGEDKKLLFITASKSIYGLRMAVQGAEVF